MNGIKVDRNKIVNYVRQQYKNGNVVSSYDLIEYIVITFDISRDYAWHVSKKLVDVGRLKRLPGRIIEAA